MSDKNGEWDEKKMAAGSAEEAVEERSEDPLINWVRPLTEECPICMLPLPLDGRQSSFRHCCGKTICGGCLYDHMLVDFKEGRRTLDTSSARICPFCRTDILTVGILGRNMKLANAGNHDAMYRIGNYHFYGQQGVQQDREEGIKWYRRAADAGSSEATYSLGNKYLIGDGVEEDHDRALEHFQKAVELGFVRAFADIGGILLQKGEMEEAMLNLRKAAICGDSEEVIFKALRLGYNDGYITKEEYAFTLRENQKVSDEMKSGSREIYRHQIARSNEE